MLENLRAKLVEQKCEFPIYLDNQSTTAVDPRVFEAMIPYFTQNYGNPHSRSHSFGWIAEEACEDARRKIATLIGADSREIIFTSGATESNNMAIKGTANFYKNKKRHIITVVTEHKCVLDSCRHLEQDGFNVTYLPVEKNGIINLDNLRNVITKDTLLVSVMCVNNEIGVVQPMKDIGKICRDSGVLFHSDIAQAFGKIPVDVNEMNIDLASISGHKIYAPKGIGALYVRRKPRVRLAPLINGGGQERGFRSGTLPTALVVGLGKASEIALLEMDQELARVKKLFNKFVNTIQSRAADVYLNGDKENRYYGNINLSFSYIEGESMILSIKDLAVSSGSACTSNSLEPSYVLRALAIDDTMAHTSIRFGVGRFTTEEQLDYAAELVLSKIEALRALSPLWEMVQEGIDITKIQWSTH
ncbi:IscS subfamily cysteine desulfurase [Rickettsia endosymbiont of Cardiosporidium cionae]|uniref:IscS subfamily cysteine desulfurase n=1 Tax=Rickettsia endosymbiont of Cardiosporidium cionae TaxID=2777155 RepID=UPI001893BD80|nr:IscS subfamily cysteine desulfurase [Rickettsia endosymbiont of Cardiosporidium cionae]KAF8818829.1 IscS subfamily cysteine desulfurase [Rickettsia endosymbiont of Cardiosporidium cionae]